MDRYKRIAVVRFLAGLIILVLVLNRVSAFGASGSTRPTAVADRFNMAENNYRVTVEYRRNIYRPWLFLELIPETNWRGHRALLPAPLVVKEPLPIPESELY